MPTISPGDEGLWETTVARLLADPVALRDLRTAIGAKYRRRRVADFVGEILSLLSAPAYRP